MYLLQVRPPPDIKEKLRNMIYDLAETFDSPEITEPRPVPHITLFGPYDTEQGNECKKRLVEALQNIDPPKYKISGFGMFEHSNVVYANIQPSTAFREMRRSLFLKQAPLSSGYQDHDCDYEYEYHITIANVKKTNLARSMLEYLRDQYSYEEEVYATRVSALDGRSMMYEFDIPRKTLLSQKKAVSSESWKKTKQALQKTAENEGAANQHSRPTGMLRRSKWLIFTRCFC